jgi:hypothetical protein
MKKHISFLVIIACICLFPSNINAQVIQQQADKWQLTNGVRLVPKTSKKNIIKIEATSIISTKDSDNIKDVAKKKDKVIKPPKVLKYGSQRTSEGIKKEDDE